MNLSMLFDISVHRHASKSALISSKKSYTYKELEEEVNRMASSLQKLGIKKQDRLMVILKNNIENVIIFWACQKLGVIYTPVNFRLSIDDFYFCVKDIEPKVVVYEPFSEHLVKKEVFAERPILIGVNGAKADISYEELIDQGTSSYSRPDISYEDIAMILYTSGTTGVPKGVPRTHINEYTSSLAHIIQCRYKTFDRTLLAVPMYHVIGIRSLLAVSLLSGSAVLMTEFDPKDSLQAIEEEKVTCLFLTPTYYHDMVYHPDAPKHDLSNVHTIAYSGSPMSDELVRKCDEVFSPQRFVNHYGSTEIYTFTYCEDIRLKGSGGKPGIHQNIRLISPNSRPDSMAEAEMKEGEVGQIVINMNSVEAFKGYWNRPDATRDAISSDWYYTGDLGYFNKEGNLVVVGRADDMIISGGENIYPFHIENVLKEHPGIREVIVVGEADKRWGQIVAAFIVPEDPSLKVQDLDQFCKKHPQLSNVNRPRKYTFVSEIPKSKTGKILRRKLREGFYKQI
ncbi:class I adenylate-forming enzyme family protein [Thalassobacillus sp. C254]|uniref:class I adenylate-forming enzyme family protein n=1 Tax=Thalassobacillus sp. C254 TaxID=1225341 RepID=UPI0006CFDC47|nr:class I adenylate-forming enzyme family protein [Thalassobacillus sp. C254]